MMSARYGKALAVSSMMLACAMAAQASTLTFQVMNEARAVVTTSTNTITVSLTDLYVNPAIVTDNLSAFFFATSITASSASIAYSSADSIDIAGDGTYTDPGTVSPGWVLSLASGVTKLDDLSGGGAGSAHTIVGAPSASNVYSNGNGSIDGNRLHNPFLNQTAMWTLTENGITPATTISNVVFQFGATDGLHQVSGTQVVTSEPATAGMLFLGVSVLLLARKSLMRIGGR
jgi:hypothetical protein